jgi:hypothetical protein
MRLMETFLVWQLRPHHSTTEIPAQSAQTDIANRSGSKD